MIYLDVTSACQSPLNTGVKRMQRGLHRWLDQREDYEPICWQSVRNTYRVLRPSDLPNLDQTREASGLALYDSFAPGMLTDWLHVASDQRYLLNLFKECGPVDVLLMPDLLWDNRGALLARLWETGLRRVAIFHDAIALRRPGQSRVDRHYCAKGVRALADMDSVLCISEEAEDDLHHFWHKFKCRPTSTHVVPWPVPFNGERPLSYPNFNTKRLLYVARLEPHKNHLRLLDACEKLWRGGLVFELRLIGCKAYPDTAWRIGRRVNSLRRKGRGVQWEPHVKEEELLAAYRDCAFTVFPSLIEGFGLPIIESLWHGRPVVCGNEGALGEVSEGGGCEAIDPESIDSIASGIRRLLTEEQHYGDLYMETKAREFRDWAQYWLEVETALS